MNFDQLIHIRHSMRAYKPDPVPDAMLAKVLDAAVQAPTASNRQPFQVIVIHTEGRKENLARIYHREWFVQAPIILCVVGLVNQAWVRDFDGFNAMVVDASIVMDHMILAATELGLGTCWIAHFDPAIVREELRLPPEAEPLLFTPLGFPNGEPRLTKRKTLDELVRYENW